MVDYETVHPLPMGRPTRRKPGAPVVWDEKTADKTFVPHIRGRGDKASDRRGVREGEKHIIPGGAVPSITNYAGWHAQFMEVPRGLFRGAVL